MARKSTKSLSEDLENFDGHEDEFAGEENDLPAKSISKAGAARAALAEGITVPKKASVYIKQKYGIDISPQQFSAEKCRLKQRSNDPAVATSFGLLRQQGAGILSLGKRSSTDQTGLLEALEVMKPLIDQLGPDKVKRMVDLLG